MVSREKKRLVPTASSDASPADLSERQIGEHGRTGLGISLSCARGGQLGVVVNIAEQCNEPVSVMQKKAPRLWCTRCVLVRNATRGGRAPQREGKGAAARDAGLPWADGRGVLEAPSAEYRYSHR